jgi:Zn-dependent protease
MSAWEDPDERVRPVGFGGDWRGTKPTFNDPMSWSFPIFRVARISVRLHVFFLVFVLAMVARAAATGGAFGLAPTLLGLAALFGVILLHEFGHCVACRAVGGRADEVLLWPLGGLASCEPPARPNAHLWTALGGPLVNVAIMALLTPLIGLRTGHWFGVAVPNPFDLGAMFQRVDPGVGTGGGVFGGVLPEPFGGWLEMLVLLTNAIAWLLLVFNLLPMFPLDGGRIVQAILWRRRGYARSMRAACRSGLVGAVILCIVALASDSTMLLAIALFGGIVCYTTVRQVDHERDMLGFEADPSELAAFEEELTAEREPEVRAARPAPRDAKRAVDADAAIDAILDKIARSGIGSLTASEREVLARETERKRDGGKGDRRS